VASGAAAVVLEVNRELTPAQVRIALQMTSGFLPSAGLLGAGTGLLNLAAAVQMAIVGPGLPNIASVIGGELVDASGFAFGDTILWGTARETILWGSARDTILWGTARDTILWGSARDTILWGSARETILWGSAARDTILWGTATPDTILWGTAGRDTILWGSANDTILWGTTRPWA
jgi:Ca2+-binding RTX toxin-like protein